MALSIALVIIFGLVGNIVFVKMKLPGLLGMLLVGVVIGPFCLGLLDDSILAASKDIRTIALIVILLRAGLGLNVKDVKASGKPAIFLSFLPCILEGIMIIILSMMLLDFDYIEAGMLGFIIAAVSPAVVVPLMLKLINEKKGKKIPVLVLASASVDDVVCITFFMTFMGFYYNSSFPIARQLFNIPASIILGVLLGLIVGICLVFIFKKIHIRDSKKVIIILAFSILMVTLQDFVLEVIMISSLLGIMTIGIVINEMKPELGKRLALKFNKIWVFTEIFLFVLIGAAVNIDVAFNAGLIGAVIIILGLLARSLGVIISTYKSSLSKKERLFIVYSYVPKATVQAAIGSIPLAAGVPHGEIILALSVMAIIITAPLGSILITLGSKKLLKSENNSVI